MIFSIINIAYGPVSQLLIHSRQIKKLIVMTIIRILTVFFSAIIANFIGLYQLFFFALLIVFVDVFVLLFASRSLYNKIGYITPFYQKLNKILSR